MVQVRYSLINEAFVILHVVDEFVALDWALKDSAVVASLRHMYIYGNFQWSLKGG